jgi:hypothetical protein
MFEALRAGKSTRGLPVEGEMLTGARFIELSVRLAKHRFDRWVDWGPGPDALAESGAGEEGNQLFFGALGWIMRHKLAHHVLKHPLRSGIPADSKARKLEAGDQATAWRNGRRAAEPAQQFGARFLRPRWARAARLGDAGRNDLGGTV